ncbi:MAG: sensor histidine kinase [Coleofasciculaceae cyanobacterium SM2_1_6]|nr:sensor histidine kinase [Coleofasciculaceae cyanobacterium SM2_1_6]
MPKAPRSPLPLPSVTSPNNQDLSLDATVANLPLHSFTVETNYQGQEIATIFEQYPLLPGVVLLDKGKFLGMISRRRFLEYLLRPQGLKLFLRQPLRVLYSYAQIRNLIVPYTTTILTTTQLALRRPSELQGEPIVIQGPREAEQPDSSDPEFLPDFSESKDNYYLLDIQELYLADWQIRGIEAQVRYEQNQAQMIQMEKMANLGRLVDGVAHEILDPVNFIWGNLNYVHLYSEQLLELINAYETATVTAELKENIEFDFLQSDLPRTISSIRTGAERLKKLVTSLQNFCHLDDVYPKPADLHQCLDSILILLKSRLQKDIAIVTDYGYLPPVPCFVGQLSQVFINILGDAVDNLLNDKLSDTFDRYPEENKPVKIQNPTITITTKIYSGSQIRAATSDSRWVSIRIANNGSAFSAPRKQRILSSFTGERKHRKETSLALSHWIVTAKHGGKLELRSPIPELSPTPDTPLGTEFEIILPLV